MIMELSTFDWHPDQDAKLNMALLLQNHFIIYELNLLLQNSETLKK